MKISKRSKKKLIIVSLIGIFIAVLFSIGMIDTNSRNLLFNLIGINTDETTNKNDINENNNSNSSDDNNIANNPLPDFTEATVKRIVDGDTIVVIMDNKEYKVRFIGVNCPEYTSKIEPYGKEATEYTTNTLTNKTVYLQKDVNETDKYGRLLRYVWLEKPTNINEEEIKTKMFNAKLVIDGYAYASSYPPDIKYQKYFTNFQKQARDNNSGLWK